jgi:hypothetical protein
LSFVVGIHDLPGPMNRSGKKTWMRRISIIVGGVGAVIALGLLFPVGCGSTEIAIPEGGPDPNAASCSTLVFDEPSWAQIEDGHPRTDRETTSHDLLWRRMTSRAVGVAAIPLAAGLIAAWLLGRR